MDGGLSRQRLLSGVDLTVVQVLVLDRRTVAQAWASPRSTGTVDASELETRPISHALAVGWRWSKVEDVASSARDLNLIVALVHPPKLLGDLRARRYRSVVAPTLTLP